MGRRKTGTMPTVSIHAASQNARVRIAGKTYWLGKCKQSRVSKEQEAKAARLWNLHLSGELEEQTVPARQTTPSKARAKAEPCPMPEGITIAELGLKYLDHAESYYRTNDGGTTSSVVGIRMALRALFAFSDLRATSFGPKALKQLQANLVRDGRYRKTVNTICKAIRRLFKWAASEELVPVVVWRALETVPGLQKGRTDAPELSWVKEVPDETVEATLPHLFRIVATMVQVQRLTGARPGEICGLRPADIDRTETVWKWQPPHHKTSWREKDRVISIGPRGQQILT